MFNVVFLVSGGEPDGTTDILVSEAYRWAFTARRAVRLRGGVRGAHLLAARGERARRSAAAAGVAEEAAV